MTVGVIGAGLQGALAAIELARRGHDVVVFERGRAPLEGASRWNEGKIHLGYLFANDPSLRTARTLVDGATRFWPLLARYLERDLDFISRSDGFVYAVHRDSLLPPDAVAAHLDRAHLLATEALAHGRRNYLGATTLAAPRRSAVAAHSLNDEKIAAAFETDERSIDVHALADAVRERLLGEPRIKVVPGTEISAISRAHDGRFVLQGANGAAHGSFEQVVNAAWEQRLRLDETLGYRPANSWMHRYKLALHVEVDRPRHDVPSITVVLGPFGDVVNFHGRQLYLSWYPIGRISASDELVPPPMDEAVAAARLDGFASAITSRLAEILPALTDLDLGGDRALLNGGYIFAWGRTDISDVESGLHNRYDIGVHSDRGYHSIDTGKLTMAPRNAEIVGELIGDA